MKQVLNVYMAKMELHGVLIYATEQRPSLAPEGGAVISTGNFIHNYSLIYGFTNQDAESYAVIPSLHFATYSEIPKSKQRGELRYTSIEKQLRALIEKDKSIYVFPASPLKVTQKKFFMAAKGSGYAEFRGALKTVYPRLVHYVALIPPSEFITFVMTYEIELPRVMYVRIGMKRAALFRVSLLKAEIDKRLDNLSWTSVPVNLHDVVLFGYEPKDVLKVLETRSKPPNKPLAAIIGYVMCRNLFMVKCGVEKYRIPLPTKLIE